MTAPELTPADELPWEDLLGLLPALPGAPTSAGRDEGPGDDQAATVAPDAKTGVLARFVRIAYDSGFVEGFDWLTWSGGAGQRFLREPHAVDHATLDELRRLLIAYLRADRFTEGLLDEIFESGQLRRMLLRAAELRGPPPAGGRR